MYLLWKGVGILMEGSVDSSGRVCDFVLHYIVYLKV
jgi:hypothetical protein